MKVCIKALLVLLLAPAVLRAQETAIVEFDHATGRARLIMDGDTSELGKSPTVRLHRSIPVEVRVVNTNTAVYAFTTKTESTALPEVQSVQSFMSTLNPYLPGLRAAVQSSLRKGPGAGERAPDANAAYVAVATASNSARNSMLQLGDVLYGEAGLQDIMTSSLLALEQMRQGVAPERASESLRRSLQLGPPCREEEVVRLSVAQRLLSALTQVVQASQELRTALDMSQGFFDERLNAARDSAQSIERQTQAALADFEPLVANAYRIERLVGTVASACSEWSAGEVRGTLTSGREVTVRVEPRTEVETSRIADREATTYTVLVQPKPIIRPALGFTALAAPDARFANYSTRPVEGGVQVYQSGERDARFAVGGTLGFTWPGLDQRDTHGIAVWLPEFTIAPGRVTAFGVGGGLSWNFLKLGAGLAWIRHGAPDGVAAGDVLPDESGLQINDTYSAPKFYLSLGVFDWAPLVGRLRRD